MYRKHKLDNPPFYCLNSTLIVIVLPRLVSKWVSSLIYLVSTLSQSSVQALSTPNYSSWDPSSKSSHFPFPPPPPCCFFSFLPSMCVCQCVWVFMCVILLLHNTEYCISLELLLYEENVGVWWCLQQKRTHTGTFKLILDDRGLYEGNAFLKDPATSLRCFFLYHSSVNSFHRYVLQRLMVYSGNTHTDCVYSTPVEQ